LVGASAASATAPATATTCLVGMAVSDFCEFSWANSDNFYIKVESFAGELVIAVEYDLFVIDMANH
jgi:hypothetical protein